MIAQNHVCVLRLSCIGVAICAARKVQIAWWAMTSKTFLHNCDICEPECANDAISMGPEIYGIDLTFDSLDLVDAPPNKFPRHAKRTP